MPRIPSRQERVAVPLSPLASGLLLLFAAHFISSCHSDRIGAPISLSTGLAVKPGESGDLVLADTAGIIRGSSVFFLDPLSLNVIDSLTPNDLGTETNVLEQVVPTLTGDLLFLRTRTTLKRFDNQSRATTAEIAAPTLGSLRLSLDETNLLLTDPGAGVDFGGSGHVYVFTAANLDGRGTIALPLGEGGYPRPSWGAAPGLEPPVMYLVTGTSRFGPFPTPQESAVITLDLVLMRAVRVTELNDLGSGTVFVF